MCVGELVIKVNISLVDNKNEESLDLKICKMNDSVLRLINMLKLQDIYILGTIDNKIHKIELADIYYFETVERKLFVYDRDDTYEIKDKNLTDLEAELEGTKFIRVSRYTIINIDKLESITPTISRNFVVLLDNGDKVQASRGYIDNLKDQLGVVE